MSAAAVVTWRRILELIEDGRIESAAALYVRSGLTAADEAALDERGREALRTLLPLVAQHLAGLQALLREQERRVGEARPPDVGPRGAGWLG